MNTTIFWKRLLSLTLALLLVVGMLPQHTHASETNVARAIYNGGMTLDFATFDDAFAFVKNYNGGTVQLIADCSASALLTVSQSYENVTIDLAGHNLTLVGVDMTAGNLTITDSGETKGQLACARSDGNCHLDLKPEGSSAVTLKIDGAKVTSEQSTLIRSIHPRFDDATSVNVEITDSTLEGLDVIIAAANTTVRIRNSTITADDLAIELKNNAVFYDDVPTRFSSALIESSCISGAGCVIMAEGTSLTVTGTQEAPASFTSSENDRSCINARQAKLSLTHVNISSGFDAVSMAGGTGSFTDCTFDDRTSLSLSAVATFTDCTFPADSFLISSNALATCFGCTREKINNPIYIYNPGGLIFWDEAGTTASVYGNVTLSEDLTIPEGTTYDFISYGYYDPKNPSKLIPGEHTVTNNGTILIDGVPHLCGTAVTVEKLNETQHHTKTACPDCPLGIVEYSNVDNHTETTAANCQSPAYCGVCDSTYGETGDHSIDPATGGCTVCGTTFDASITRDGVTTNYTTLAEAAAAVTEGDTVTILRDVTVGQDETVAFAAFAKLDANGHTVTCSGTVTIGGEAGIIFDNALYYHGGDVTEKGLFLDSVENATYYTAGEGHACFFPSDGENPALLRLNNATIRGYDYVSFSTSYTSNGILYRNSTEENTDLVVQFFGENIVAGRTGYDGSTGIYIDGGLTLEGADGAVLSVSSGFANSGTNAINVQNLYITGGTVNAAPGTLNTGSIPAVITTVNNPSGGEIIVSDNAALNIDDGGVFGSTVISAHHVEGSFNALIVNYETDAASQVNITYCVYGSMTVSLDTTLLYFDADYARMGFVVPAGSSLTVKDGVTLDLSKWDAACIDLSGTVTNNGTIKFPTDFPLADAPKGGTVYIGEKRYTWDEVNNKWICGSEASHFGGETTCMGCLCEICGAWYGERDENAHSFTDGICALCGAESYGIWVGATVVTSANAADVLGDGTVSFDAATNTLTLNNAAVDTSGLNIPALSVPSGDVTLVLRGASSLTGYRSDTPLHNEETGSWYGYAAIHIGEGASLTVTGGEEDTLTLKGNAFGYTKIDHIAVTAAISGSGDLAVTGGTVITDGISLDGDYTQTGGSVTADFLNVENATVSGGVLVSRGDNGFQYEDGNFGGTHGICASRNITVTGGTVTASGGLLASSSDFRSLLIDGAAGSDVLPDGLCAGGSVTVTGGTVTASGSGTKYRIGELGIAELGSYVEEEEPVDDGLNGYAIDAPEFHISEEATFICGSENSHLGSAVTCVDPSVCLFCGQHLADAEPDNHTMDYTADEEADTITYACAHCDTQTVVFTLVIPTGGVYGTSSIAVPHYDCSDRTYGGTLPVITVGGVELKDFVIQAGLYDVVMTWGNVSVSGSYEIAKAYPTVAAPINLNATYGQRLEHIPLNTEPGDTPGSWAWNDPGASVGDAGVHTFRATFTPTDSINYRTVEADLEVTVQKAPTDISRLSDISKIYDGTPVDAPNYIQVGEGVPTIEYKVSGADDSTYATTAPVNAGSYIVRVSLAESRNYAGSSASLPFTIGKAATQDLADTLTVANGCAHTYTVDLSAYLPEFGDWGDPELLSLRITENSLDAAYCDHDLVTIENGKLILPILAAASDVEGCLGSISVVIESQNFQDSTLVFTVNSANHQHDWSFSAAGDTITATCESTFGACSDPVQTIRILAPAGSMLYDGLERTATLEGSIADVADPTITYTGDRKSVGTHWASIALGDAVAMVSFTITIPDAIADPAVPNGENGWYTNVELAAPDGYMISDLEDGSFSHRLAVPNGAHTDFTYWLKPVSNNDAAAVMLTWANTLQVDNILPTVSAEAADVTDTAATVRVTVRDDLSGVAGVTLSVEPADPNVVIGTYTDGAISVTGMQPNRSYRFHLIVRDAAGNQSRTELTVTTLKADATVETAPAANELIYNGKDQPLVTGGAAKGGTLVYSLTEDGTYTETVPTGKNAGSYTVYCKVIGDEDHNDSAVASVEVTIGKATPTFVWESTALTVTYSGEAPVIQAPAVVLVDGEVFSGTVSLSCDGSRIIPVNAGTYTVTAAVDEQDNYEAARSEITLIIGKKELTVQADRGRKTYGDADPKLTYTVSGLIGNDTLSGSLDRVAGENVGSYAISLGSLTGGNNYSIRFSGNTFTVYPRSITVTATDQTVTYGNTISRTAFTSDGLLNGHIITATLTPSTTNVTISGTVSPSRAVITANGADVTANYDIRYAYGSLVIRPDTAGIDDLTAENVTSADKAAIEAAREMMENADSVDEAWENIPDKCDALLARIDEVADEIQTLTSKVSGYDENTVTSGDLEELEQLAQNIEDLLDTDNLTGTERSAMEALLEQVEGLIDGIENATKPTEAPTETPTEAPTGTPTDAPTEAPTDDPTEPSADGPASPNLWIIIPGILLLILLILVLLIRKRKSDA